MLRFIHMLPVNRGEISWAGLLARPCSIQARTFHSAVSVLVNILQNLAYRTWRQTFFIQAPFIEIAQPLNYSAAS